MKKILVRADDLGYCEEINYGIAKSVKEGIINSVVHDKHANCGARTKFAERRKSMLWSAYKYLCRQAFDRPQINSESYRVKR